MKLIINIPEEEWLFTKAKIVSEDDSYVDRSVANGTPIPDNAKNGKEVLIKYCLEHSGEEIYDLLKRVHDESMSWTDSRGFIIDWLERGKE